MKKLHCLLAVTSVSFAFPVTEFHEPLMLRLGHATIRNISVIPNEHIRTPFTSISLMNPFLLNKPPQAKVIQTQTLSSEAIQLLLQTEATSLNRDVIHKVISTLQCASNYNVEHNQILTIIDYSLPSSEKRLWIFDLHEKKLLFHTYVSHGINSGLLLTNNFSNKNNSKATSMGVYTTEKAYYGRDGLSLRLDGLDSGFNDNASGRSIVMHGGWYVEEDFIKKYGRAGRSWGCPAVPLNMTQAIINTIKDKSIFVAYYPSDRWFLKSKFLKCDVIDASRPLASFISTINLGYSEREFRDEVLFADLHHNKIHNDTRPVLAMSAPHYEQIFHTKVPLTRMLRRQINHIEYVALSDTEFKSIVTQQKQMPEQSGLNTVNLVTPEIKMIRGYYETQMKIVDVGKIKEVTLNTDSYTVYFEKNTTLNFRPTHQFIRWVGL